MDDFLNSLPDNNKNFLDTLEPAQQKPAPSTWENIKNDIKTNIIDPYLNGAQQAWDESLRAENQRVQHIQETYDSLGDNGMSEGEKAQYTIQNNPYTADDQAYEKSAGKQLWKGTVQPVIMGASMVPGPQQAVLAPAAGADWLGDVAEKAHSDGIGAAVRDNTYGPIVDWASQDDLGKNVMERPVSTIGQGALATLPAVIGGKMVYRVAKAGVGRVGEYVSERNSVDESIPEAPQATDASFLDTLPDANGSRSPAPSSDGVPLGDNAFSYAVEKSGTPYELGGDGVASTDCGKLVQDSFNAAGVDWNNRYVPSMIAEAQEKGAWHPAGDGYIPQKGDAAVVLGDNHVILADGEGGYVGANSSTGVIKKPSIADDFGDVTGYISVDDMTGGRRAQAKAIPQADPYRTGESDFQPGDDFKAADIPNDNADIFGRPTEQLADEFPAAAMAKESALPPKESFMDMPIEKATPQDFENHIYSKIEELPPEQRPIDISLEMKQPKMLTPEEDALKIFNDEAQKAGFPIDKPAEFPGAREFSKAPDYQKIVQDEFIDPVDKHLGAAPEYAPGAGVVSKMAEQSPFIKNDIVPKVENAIKTIADTKNDIQQTFAPSTVSDFSKLTAQTMREHLADMAQKADRASAGLTPARDYFSKQTSEHNLAFMDAMESGSKHASPEIQSFADSMRKALDDRVKQIQALGTGKLQSYIENYFPHIWEDPNKATNFAAAWSGKRPFEGNKSFLKKRSIPTIKDGIEAGLKPISTNPVDLTLMKMREMDKYIMAHKTLSEEKKAGRCVFVRDVVGEKAPEGWGKIDDKVGTVYGPPTVDVKEAFDPAIMNTLNKTIDKLDVYRSRLTKIPLGKEAAGVWGLADDGSREIMTKFGGPESVLAHELGHQLAYIYHLGDILKSDRTPIRINGKTVSAGEEMSRELTMLADKRMDPNSMNESERAYVQGGTEPIAAVVEAYVHAPEILKETAPLVYKNFLKFLDAHPELHDLRDIKPSLLLDEATAKQAVGGLVTKGHYYMPAESARLINNYLSPGLRDKSSLFQSYLGAANVMNQFQLGLSAFHLGFTSMDSAVSKVALGIIKSSHGDVFSGLKDIAHAPIAPVENALRGNTLIKEWMKPGSTDTSTANIVDAMKAGGGRVKMDDMYHTNIAQAMKDAYNQGNYIGAAMRVPFAIMEQATKPILEYIVPRQKCGVFADLMRYEMERRPNMSRQDLRETAGKIWDSVDNRLGQLCYDNLFWNKTTKDILMASTRSVGWNLGTWRELGGAGIDAAKFTKDKLSGSKADFTYRMSYAMALPITVGLVGAITQYMYTGQAPQDMKDLFYPRTGTLDQNGRPQRIELPSYMKDLYAYYDHPGTTLTNKLHPMLSTIADMLKNKDYYGREIYNKDDSFVQKAGDMLAFAGKQFVPFAVQGSKYNADLGGDFLSKGLPFFGVTPAPSDINKTDVEKKISEMLANRMPAGSETKEQADKRDLKRSLLRDMILNNGQATDSVYDALKNGKINRDDAKRLLNESRMNPLERATQSLKSDDVKSLIEVAEPQEKDTLDKIYRKKLNNQRK